MRDREETEEADREAGQKTDRSADPGTEKREDMGLYGYALLILAGTLIAAVSQVMLKIEANKPHKSRLQEYLNPLVIFSYILFVGTTLLSVLAYRGIPLSMGPILEATGYLYVTLFGVKIFGEKVNKGKVAALVLIIGGIAVYSLWG